MKFLRILAISPLLAALFCNPAQALILGGKIQSSPLIFGTLTPKGYGGLQTSNSSGSAITGSCASDWHIDSNGRFDSVGTYGANPWTPSGSYPCSVTLANGQALTIQTPALSATVRLDYSGGGQDYPEFNAATALLAGGDTLYLQSGDYNLAGSKSYATFPNTYASPLVVQSSVVDTSGNRRHGTRVGGFFLNDVGTQKATYKHIWFYTTNGNNSTVLQWNMQAEDCTFEVDDSRFEADPSIPFSTLAGDTGTGYSGPTISCASGTATMQDNTFNHVGNVMFAGASPTNGTGPSAVWKRNTGYGWSGDFMHFTGHDGDFEDNFASAYGYDSNNHPDFFQCPNAPVNANANFGSFLRNVQVHGANAVQSDTQFFAGGNTTYHYQNAVIENNAKETYETAGVVADGFDNMTVAYNTLLGDSAGSSNGANLDFGSAPGTGGSGGLASHNVAGGYNDNHVGTAPTFDHNVTIGTSLSAVTYAFPNHPQNDTTDQLINTRAQALVLFTPGDTAVTNNTSATGVVYQVTVTGTNAGSGDGTVAGALFPACSGQVNGAWNDGTPFHISGGYYACNDATWLAAHPPAT